MEKQEVSLAELKGHPFIDQVLAFNGQKAFYDFVEMVTNKKNLTNKDYQYR